jgi:hypothetical protein
VVPSEVGYGIADTGSLEAIDDEPRVELNKKRPVFAGLMYSD